MNANQIINDEMSLEEKLAAIDKAMAEQRDQMSIRPNSPNLGLVEDPYDSLMCEGCQ